MTLGDLVDRICADMERIIDCKTDELIRTFAARGATLEELQGLVDWNERALDEGRKRAIAMALSAWDGASPERIQ